MLNVPSSDSTPQSGDLEVASNVAIAAQVVGVKLDDMIIVSADGFWSWRDPGD